MATATHNLEHMSSVKFLLLVHYLASWHRMKAAIYNSSQSGIGIRSIEPPILRPPKPTLLSSLIAFLTSDQYGFRVSSPRKYVLCKVSSAALNPVDAKFLYGDKLPQFLLPLVKFALSFINAGVGIDFEGQVVESQSGSRFKLGDRVFGTVPPSFGSIRDFVQVPQDFVAHSPSRGIKFASSVPLVGLTCLQAFNFGKVKPGDHVLIVGGSGGVGEFGSLIVGHVAVQIAKNLGAKVTAIASSRNEKIVHKFGADCIVLYDLDDLALKISQSTQLRGAFAVVLDTVTSGDAQDKIHNYKSRLSPYLDPKGIYITLGGGLWDWTLAHLKRFLGIDLFPKNRALHWVRFSHATKELEQLALWIEQGKLSVNVGKVYEFTLPELEEAFRAQLTRRIVGKIVVEVN